MRRGPTDGAARGGGAVGRKINILRSIVGKAGYAAGENHESVRDVDQRPDSFRILCSRDMGDRSGEAGEPGDLNLCENPPLHRPAPSYFLSFRLSLQSLEISLGRRRFTTVDTIVIQE